MMKYFLAKNKKPASIISFIALMGFGCLFWLIGSGKGNNRDLQNYTLNAISGTLPGLITSSGELKAKRAVNVSPEKQGLLEEIYVEEGDLVAKGQLLAKMKFGDYKYRLQEIKSDYEKDKASYERRKELFIEGAISAEDNDEYLNRFLKSKARLNKIKLEGNDLIIKAPFKGLITSRYSEPGAFVTPTTNASSTAGSTSTSIVELSQGIEVVAKVPESDIGRIQLNQYAQVRVDAFPEQRFQAKVNAISPRAVKTNNVTSFEVKLIFLKPPEKLRIGMTADVEFQTGPTTESTLVPSVAIVTRNGKPGVLIVGEKNQPTFKEVELGSSSGSKTAIIKGLKPGEKIFIDLPPWAKQKRD